MLAFRTRLPTLSLVPPICCYATRLTGIKCSLGDIEREILIKHNAGVEGSTTLEFGRVSSFVSCKSRLHH
jgi:hypothetical protein